MRGGMGWQVTEIFNKSGILQIGSSKHSAKATARESGAKTWADLGQELAIYSFSTASSYKDTWHLFSSFAKEKFKLRDIEKVTSEQVREYLLSRLAEGIAIATFVREAAALSKLENCLNMYSSKYDRGNKYEFRSDIRQTVKDAKRLLPKPDPHRSYFFPLRVVAATSQEKHRLASHLQFEAGARIHEISLIKPAQLLGIHQDEVTGEKIGKISVRGKGGKSRDLFLKPATYFNVSAVIEAEGKFCIDKNAYGADLRQACEVVGEKYSGSHSLRWSYAQHRMDSLQSRGKTYEQALLIVSRSMGHERADITEHYLR